MPPIKLASPQIDDLQKQAVLDTLASGQLVAGKATRQFEELLSKIANTKHAIAVSSGTSALLALMEATAVGPGSVVVVPAFTFPAPAITAAFLGATVRLCDVSPDTMNISQETLAEVLDDEVTHVVAIDQFGAPAPVGELEELTGPMRVPILVDAACSVGASLAGKPCGSLGRAATFSFHPRKIITTGEGGAVVTDDDALATKVRRFRNIGIEDGTFHGIGLNLRPSEMGCAMGIHQLQRLDEILETRRTLAARYRASLPMLGFQEPIPFATVNHQTLAALLPQGTDRDALRAHLLHNEVESQVASYSIRRLDRLARKLSVLDARTPHADRLHDRAIALPLHQAMTETDVDRVVELVAGFIHR